MYMPITCICFGDACTYVFVIRVYVLMIHVCVLVLLISCSDICTYVSCCYFHQAGVEESRGDSDEKLKQQQVDATRRENVLVMRLTTKEQEMQEYLVGEIWCLKIILHYTVVFNENNDGLTK